MPLNLTRTSSLLLRAISYPTLVSKMSAAPPKAAALHSTAQLRDANAPTYKSMTGKVHPALLKSLEVMGFDYMTPVQAKVLQTLPAMSSDCLVQAKTGTGKTIAFLLPALQSYLTSQPAPSPSDVSILILSPTRELALQIAAEAEELVKSLPVKLEVHTAFGGTARQSNLNKFLKGKPSVLVATPGRLKDYLSEDQVRRKFRNIRTVCFDEADAMLEAGFLPDILRILETLPPKSAGWQGMCFSATMPEKIKKVISCVLAPGYSHISTVDHSEPPTHSRVPQFAVVIPSVVQTVPALLSLLKSEIARESKPKIIVFGTVANLVSLYGKIFPALLKPFKVFELHSRLSQSLRTRTTDEFRVAESGIMFATDVIGRGMDFPDVTSVIQVGVPSDSDAYIHRVGRTARAGKDGRAVILLTERERFFITSNRQLPIGPHPDNARISAPGGIDAETAVIERAMSQVDDQTKSKAYAAYMGFMKGFTGKLGVSPAAMVEMCNDFALHGMGCVETPAIEKKTIGKMGLKGVPGIRIASGDGGHEGGGGGGGRQGGGGGGGGGGRGGSAPRGSFGGQQRGGGRGHAPGSALPATHTQFGGGRQASTMSTPSAPSSGTPATNNGRPNPPYAVHTGPGMPPPTFAGSGRGGGGSGGGRGGRGGSTRGRGGPSGRGGAGGPGASRGGRPAGHVVGAQ